MFCITLKHHIWEPEVEVILSVIVSFFMLCIIIEVGIEATACAQSADTIRSKAENNGTGVSFDFGTVLEYLCSE